MKIDSGDTAWMLASAALVMLMTPGLALFYGGMVRVKSVLNMLMMSFGALALVTVLWVLYGYSLTFGKDSFAGLIGNLDHLGLAGTLTETSGSLPMLVFAAFQLMFAVITPALISGAIADRAKFGAWMLFVGVWATVVYFPVAHWVFFFDKGAGGWIADRLGALDFAGGTAVHINAGAAGLALALVLGKRLGWPKERFKPHNLPLVLLGAGLLWFGWFGFNAGSALAANGLAAAAFMNTQVASAAAVLTWLLVEKLRDGHATTLGGASGAVAGLVAITPACGSVNAGGALAIGLVAGALCALAVGLKYKLGFDDSLDVVGVHLVGGLVGSILIGVFAVPAVTGLLDPSVGTGGLLAGEGLALLGKQTLAAVVVGLYSFGMTWLIGTLIDKTIGFRLSPDDEAEGVDNTVHAESAYDLTPGGSGVSALTGAASRSAVRSSPAAPASTRETAPPAGVRTAAPTDLEPAEAHSPTPASAGKESS